MFIVGSQSSNDGPFIDILIRLSSVVVLSRLRSGLFIHFIVEKTRSTSALEPGRVEIRAKISEISGYAAIIVSLLSA